MEKANREIGIWVRSRGSLNVAVKLFRAEDRIFERLGRGEAKPRPRWNLDLLSGRRIAAHPRLGLALAEDAEPGQAQRSFLFKFAHDQRVQFLEHGLGLFFRDADLLGHVRCYLRLRHSSASLAYPVSGLQRA